MVAALEFITCYDDLIFEISSCYLPANCASSAKSELFQVKKQEMF